MVFPYAASTIWFGHEARANWHEYGELAVRRYRRPACGKLLPVRRHRGRTSFRRRRHSDR